MQRQIYARNSFISDVRKFTRYASIHGIGLAGVKSAGRLRCGWIRHHSTYLRSMQRSVGIIGCGQFSFSNISYYLQRELGNCLKICFDPDRQKAQTLAQYYRVPLVAETWRDVVEDQDVDVLFIASNHKTHSFYALEGLKRDKTVYVEKPVSVSLEQLEELNRAAKRRPGSLFAGYNRPFSAAVSTLSKLATNTDAPISLNCCVAGHRLPITHWYRQEDEGTRICGNMGHWLDLAVHILNWGRVAENWKIHVAISDEYEPDDNLAITLTSERGDLINIMMTSRLEPFEGVREVILFQQGDTMAEIRDFREMTVWHGQNVRRYTYRPKDIGHRSAILQHVNPTIDPTRRWCEVYQSSLLILKIVNMVREKRSEATLRLSATP